LSKKFSGAVVQRLNKIAVSQAAPTDSRWLLPPDAIELNDDEVHVWLVRAGPNDFSPDLLAHHLSQDEEERANRFRFDKDRRLYVVGHSALRSVLSVYSKAEAGEIRFLSGKHGKPTLAPPLAESGLEFNLSHSGELALIAAARHKVVGVDVEHTKRNFDFEEIARRFFACTEVSALLGLPEPLRREAFFKCWTSKEAFLKAKGTGLSGKLDEVEISLASDQRVQINASVPDWSLVQLAPPDEYEGALVVQGEPCPVRCFRWQPRDTVIGR
jgi:4'-phosphopantetheinyl transferase